jgi:hypothetical protein
LSDWGEPWDFISNPWPKAWCLSTDQSDGAGFSGRIYSGTCYRTLILRPDGRVSFYYDQSYCPDCRRSLEGIPTTEDVNACEDDPAKDEEECVALVDQILTYEMNHPENYVALPDETEEDIPENEDASSSSETATEDRRVLSALRRVLKA